MSYGGRVFLAELPPEQSTTGTINKIRGKSGLQVRYDSSQNERLNATSKLLGRPLEQGRLI